MADLFLLPRPADHRETGRPASFIEATPLIDVLFDQLEYLVTHSERECPQGCPDCDRLQRVKKLLLAPFHPRYLGSVSTRSTENRVTFPETAPVPV